MVSKADRIGEVLQALAYHDFELLERTVYITDYDPGPLCDERRLRDEAEKQTERHLELHHGLSSDADSDLEVQDEWCWECSKQFFAHFLGERFVAEVFLAFEEETETARKLADRRIAVSVLLKILRYLDERGEAKMKEVTSKVRSREGLGPSDAEGIEALIGQYQDSDRVTDFYADFIGRRFSRMVGRAERLRAIPVSSPVPEPVQRYVIEASRCYVLGQFLACLLVCRSALIFSLKDFLMREGKHSEVKALEAQQDDGVGGVIRLARSLGRWKMRPTLDAAWEIGDMANKAVHVGPPEPELCRELFIKTRGVLKELYS